jgi:hypothetical protein
LPTVTGPSSPARRRHFSTEMNVRHFPTIQLTAQYSGGITGWPNILIDTIEALTKATDTEDADSTVNEQV